MFRPCIDLRGGKVVQIVGSTMTDAPVSGIPESTDPVSTNHVSDRAAAWFAEQYRRDDLTGGHVIMLGPGNEEAASSALATWPMGMQVGGGISADNAPRWIDAGASHVIMTSWLFVDGAVSHRRLAAAVDAVGRDRLVIDLSCRWRDGRYWVVTERWQRFTSLPVNADTLGALAESCSEFLVHGVDVEGLQQGINLDLVQLLADGSPIACTYAGGATSVADLQVVHDMSSGRVDLTVGSALDIFGGAGVRYADCVEFNRAHR
jgi:phosphoribosylformimino-5-aminoimidazole carboxamide ribotide isomerase